MSATTPEFDRCAPQYEEHAPIQREAAAWLAEWLPATISGTSLELGAGTGFFTRHLVAKTEKLVASDIAPRMVRAGAIAFPTARWIVAGATEPPRNEAYHWIFSSSLNQWLPDPRRTLRQWHEISAPGARLLSGWFIRGTLADFFATCPEASPFVWRGVNEWLEIFRESGWSPLRHQARDFVSKHRDSATMLRQIHNAGAAVPRRIGVSRLRQAMRNYDEMHPTREGVSATFSFLRLQALRQ